MAKLLFQLLGIGHKVTNKLKKCYISKNYRRQNNKLLAIQKTTVVR